MPNVSVPAAAPGLPLETRRMFLAAGSAAAVFGALGAASAEASPAPALRRLIEAHARADARGGEIFDRFFDAREDYLERLAAVAPPNLKIDPADLKKSRERLLAGDDTANLLLYSAGRQAPEALRPQFEALAGALKAARVAAFDALEAEAARIAEQTGYAAARREQDEARREADATLSAICAFRCATPAERRLKADYLVSVADLIMQPDLEALLRVDAGLEEA